jgi:GT2 family glycosyltransferase/glycosyltransferase involved in cell wall biosynthesis
MQILVLGMHRSGTSMVARLLNMIGLYFAPEGVSTGANQENPKGFWERRDVRVLNDMVLHAAGADWHRLSGFSLEKVPESSLAEFKTEAGKIILAMDAHRPWFLKEPRFCVLAPLWLELLEFPVCVFVNRSPLEVAQSLRMRNAFPLAFGLALWERYNAEALNATRGHRRIQVNHADLMTDPVGTVRELEENLEGLGVRGLRAPSDEEIQTFIDPSLYRAKTKQIRARLSPAQRRLRDAFENGTVLLSQKAIRFSAESQEVLRQHDWWMEAQRRQIEEQREKAVALQKAIQRRDEQIQAQRRQIEEQREKAIALQKAIEKRDEQIQEQREKAIALQEAIDRRDWQIESLQKQLEEAERRWKKDLVKLGKWSDRMAHDLDRLLKSNRWRVGCWLSLKRAGSRSKEAQRFAQLIASRPRAASAEEGLGPAQSSADKGTLDGITRPSSSAPRSSAPLAVPEDVECGGQPVSIVIPVYNAHDDLIRCLESVQRHSRPDHPVIMIDDASTDERMWPLLQEWAMQHRNFRAVRNESNLGYTATVNRGCELAGAGDIILLNSDTIVPSHWIEQLAACAYSQRQVATVTAISNAAGAFSVPRKNAINNLPPGWSVDQMAAFIEHTSQRIRPAVPTGNGFCMYITSAARAAVGHFDAEHFPNGYAEENDYCLRASAAGLVHLIDDATYVFHRQSASFGPAKEQTLKKSRATLDELHPQYTQLIRQWSQMDALDPVRENMGRQIDAVLLNGIEGVLPRDERPCLLFVLHDGAGGTRFCAEDLSQAMASRYRVILLRAAVDSWSIDQFFDNRAVPVRRYSFAEPWRVDTPMTADRLAIIREICADYKVDLAHPHHLLASGPELLTLLRQLDIPIVFSFHDFYTVCPTIQLLDETQTYCAGYCSSGAGDCSLPANWFRPPLPRLKHRYVREHKRRMSAALESVDVCVTTSEASRALITEHFPALADGRFSVIEHGRDLPRLNLAQSPQPGRPLRAVFFGVLNRSKGIDLVRRLLEKSRTTGNGIELHVLGPKSGGFDPESLGAIYHGPYHRDELAERIRAIGPAVSLIPSLWPETYCYVLTESWAMGLPVLASDIGTLRERVVKHGGGWLLPVGDVEQWFGKVLALVGDPQGYATALEEIQKMEFPGVAWMAEKYDAIYKQLLARSRGTFGSKRKEIPRLTQRLVTRPQPATSANEQRAASKDTAVSGKADVVVCVHNALEDVRRCLASIVKHRSLRLNKIIVVNDGSDEQTTSYLRQFVAEAPVKTALLENPQGGYTKAANRGLAAREAGYAILLNSDTIVTPGWIDRLVACGESDSSIGIIGPISNAASWQSVPERHSPNGDWAVNELPLSLLDRVSSIFSILNTPQYPRVPLINGFCFAIKSAIIDAVGLLDENLFPNGYGEENDYCLRAGKAGFSAAIADDCYLFHAKSRSYSHETRRKLDRQSQVILHQKYGADLDKATEVLKNSPELARARSVFASVVEGRPSSILFLMNFRGAGGGVNSIVQEADGLKKIGAAVQVAIRSQDESFYRERFPGVAPNLFHGSEDTPELIAYARSFEFVVATHFKTVRLLKTILEQAPEVVPCYYVQDYEPNFFRPSDSNYREAVESYTLIPEMRCFAKTRWLCETVAQKHDVHVHKVEPSIDREIFVSDQRSKPGEPFVVCAMVRPKDEHRSPGLTFEILRRIKQEFGESAEIRIFGLEETDPFLRREPVDFEYKVLGILDRQGVAKLMRESSLFIDASTYQAFGRTGLEAMACRCATILPSEGGIGEYARDGVNTLLAAPNDAEDVLRKVRRYITEPELYRSIVEEGLNTASRYSIDGACASELQFFESLRRERGEKPPRTKHGNGASSCRSQPLTVSMDSRIAVRYCAGAPSFQTALDIFKGAWKSALPPELGLRTGEQKGFYDDARVHWVASLLPNNLRGRKILELGPFEAYDSRLFEQLGAESVLAVEGNSVNFLKCLLLKDALGLKTRFVHGGFLKFFQSTNERFDLVWASGVLYHSEAPLELLAQIGAKTDKIFLWTHYYDDSLLATSHRGEFFPENNLTEIRFGESYLLHWRTYQLEKLKDGLPLLYGRGQLPYSFWMEREDIIRMLKAMGFQFIRIHEDKKLDDMPVISLFAERPSHEFIAHPQTRVECNELGRARPYQPTITGFDQFINDQHRYYHECPTKGILIDVGIEGRLRREDALKLYEMAYYATGDILEFGTFFGLSTSILAEAVRDAGKGGRIVTMELGERYAEHARRTLTELKLSRYVEFMVGDADASCQKLVDAGRKFHFAFVDHSHAYEHVVKACRRVTQLLKPGAFCLFHDYNDRRNTDHIGVGESNNEYGVYSAVTDALDREVFDFYGINGCCSLFRRCEA